MINYNIIRGGTRAVIWTRVSTKHQEDNGGSLLSQKETCDRYATERGYQVVRYFGGAHESAKTPGKMIQEMTSFVKRDKSISTVLISEFDRFSRELWQATKMLEDMRRLGIIVIATKYGLDTRTKEGLLMAQQTLSMAQWDNQNRTDKFVGGRSDCMKAGAYIEKAPFGYYKEGKSRETFCRLDENGKLISQAFKWKLTGATNKEILEKLAARGVVLTKQKLHKILVNPFYAGKIRHKFTNMELIDGQIEPAVTYMDFLRVQEILSGRTGTTTHKAEKPAFPLTHYVRCNVDGTPLTSYVKKKKLKTRELEFGYYKCNQQGCNTNISAKEMHEKYEALLFHYDMPEGFLNDFKVLISKTMDSYSEVSAEEISTLKRHISETNKTIKEIKLRYACGKIDEDAYTVAIQEYSNRKDVLQLELDKWQINLSNQSAKIPVVIATASKIGTLWKQSDLESKKKIQNLVFPDGIFWDKKIRNYRTKKRNAMFELLDRISDTYGNEKGLPLREAVPLCG